MVQWLTTMLEKISLGMYFQQKMRQVNFVENSLASNWASAEAPQRSIGNEWSSSSRIYLVPQAQFLLSRPLLLWKIQYGNLSMMTNWATIIRSSRKPSLTNTQGRIHMLKKVRNCPPLFEPLRSINEFFVIKFYYL